MRLSPAFLALSLGVALRAQAIDLTESQFVRFVSSDGRPIDAIRLSLPDATDSGSFAWIDHEGTLHAAAADQLGAVVAADGSTSPFVPTPARARLTVRWGKDEATRAIWDSSTPIRFTVAEKGRSLALVCVLVMPGAGPVTRPQLAVSWRLSEGRGRTAGVEAVPLSFGSDTDLTLLASSLIVRLTLPADEIAEQ